MSNKFYRSTLAGGLCFVTASCGLVASAFLRDAIYAIFSFSLASIMIIWMNFRRKRLDAWERKQALDVQQSVLQQTLEEHQAALEEGKQALFWKMAHSSLNATSARILEPKVKSNLTASSENPETASSAQTKLVDAPA